jgi:hypothetical protein
VIKDTHMKNHAKPLDDLIQGLPPEIRNEVKAFVRSLIRKRQKKPGRKKLKFGWAGALKDLREQYTSVELQHKISEWRIGER